MAGGPSNLKQGDNGDGTVGWRWVFYCHLALVQLGYDRGCGAGGLVSHGLRTIEEERYRGRSNFERDVQGSHVYIFGDYVIS